MTASHSLPSKTQYKTIKQKKTVFNTAGPFGCQHCEAIDECRCRQQPYTRHEMHRGELQVKWGDVVIEVEKCFFFFFLFGKEVDQSTAERGHFDCAWFVWTKTSFFFELPAIQQTCLPAEGSSLSGFCYDCMPGPIKGACSYWAKWKGTVAVVETLSCHWWRHTSRRQAKKSSSNYAVAWIRLQLSWQVKPE